MDVFRDRRLDLTGPLTLDAWVRPGAWAGSFPILTKGQAYGIQMRDEDTLEFRIGGSTAAADVPAGWYGGSWHRVTGVYDGAALRLLIDGAEMAATPRTGAVDPGLFEINLGRNAETQQDNDLGSRRTGRGLIDDARVYSRALTAAELAADPAGQAVLALDFDSFQRRGDFLSLGISLSGTDGLVGSDRYVQPETAEMAWAQAPVRFTRTGTKVRAHNEQQAGALDVTLRWSLKEQDRTLRSGSRKVRLAPGATVEFDTGAPPANPYDRERFLTVSAAKGDWVLGHDQYAVGGHAVPGIRPVPVPGAPGLEADGNRLTVSGKDFAYRFDNGALASMRAGGRELLHGGPALDVYRPPTSNETYDWGTDDRRIWHNLGLDDLATTVTGVTSRREAHAVIVRVTSTVAGKGVSFAQTMTYRIDKRGTVTLGHEVVPDARAAALPYLPRVGVALKLPDTLRKFAWYGRGPRENYNDRRSGAPMGVYRSTVDDQYVRYSRPQAYGNHHDTRWAALTDGRSGLLVGGMSDVSVTAWDDLDRAEYDHQLPLVRNRGWVTLHASAGETGMGETPNSVLAPFRLSPTATYRHELVLRPLTAAEARTGGVPDSNVPAPCPPGVAVAVDDAAVSVEVTSRCAAGLDDATVRLAAPEGWTVTPSVVELGVVTGTGTAAFTVTAPAGTDVGTHHLTATVDTGGVFPTSTTATAVVKTPLLPGYRWLSDGAFTAVTNGWGPVEKDLSNGEQAAGDGGTLTVAGVEYEKGLGVHALSAVDVPLDGSCTRFRADAGVDDETGSGGSVVFEVWLDGVRTAVSPTLTGAGPAHRFDVDVTGARTLRLQVTDAGDGNGNDHADWAAARLACS
ncbi:hypothetical protein Abr02nite_74380 [Paractinoplanes brasiliensis]|nr:hypothetical protein Abr02nite_74380 [Actinoplanes brasiliensis]